MSTFSERIKELRSEKGLSLRDAEKELKAKGINIDFTSISKYERGEREPSVSDAGKLADYYNVSVNISTLNYRQAEKRPLTDAEKDIVLSLDNWDGLAMRIMYYTGMRAGEVMGLAWADIKSDGIHVTHNRTNYGIGELKTQSSYRIIPIPEQLRNELNSVKKSGVYVFSHENGKVRTVSSLEYNIKQKVGVSSHYLRHNYATMLYASGVDLKTAQHLLGHSSLKMTMDIYTHLDQEKKNNSIEKLMKHFG